MTISCVLRVVSVASVALASFAPNAAAQSKDQGPLRDIPAVNGVPLVLRGSPGIQSRGDTAPIDDDALWFNGEQDGNVAFLSTVNPHVSSIVADDCWLKEGMFYKSDYVYVRMAVTEGYLPNTRLWIMPDCDGKPDHSDPLFVDQFDYVVHDPAPTGDLEGFVIYEICYYVDSFGAGEDLSWIAPVHDQVDRDMDPATVEGGYAFWLSAGKGAIQGREAHVNAPVFGLPAWSPASSELCCGICTDMYLRVEGECCWRVLDQANADFGAAGGLYDNVLSQNAPWVRSFDDFQLADPCGEIDAWSVCRIEATVATNCDIETIFAEIYNNDCDDPSLHGVGLLHSLAPTQVIDLSTTVDGLPVYRFVFECPEDVTLADGQNYWLSVFSEQGFAAGKRHVWLFEERDACNLRLNEARYWNPAIGFEPPTPVSDMDLAGEARGHSFSVWVCADGVVTSDPGGDDGTTGDDDDADTVDDDIAPNRRPNIIGWDDPIGVGSGSGGP